MSEVISFRLNKGNPREARALDVIRMLYDQGYSVRHIITEALITYGEHREPGFKNELVLELNEMLGKVSLLIDKVESPSRPRLPRDPKNSPLLTEEFKASLIKSVKPGIKYQ